MLQYIIAVLVVSLVLFYGKAYYFLRNKGMRNLSTPTIWPFAGHIFEFIGVDEIHTFFPRVQKLQKKYGEMMLIFSVSLCPYVHIADIKVTEFFLRDTKHISKAWEYTLLKPWLGDGLLNSTGSKWHKRRKILTPAFHFKILEQFVDVINKRVNVLLKKLKKSAGKDVDIYPLINLCALDVICETAMGTSIDAQNNENSEYLRATRTMLTLLYMKIFNWWKQFPLLYKLFSKSYAEEKKAVEILHNFTRSIIDKRRQQLLLDETNGPDTNLHSSPKRKLAFLDLLLQATLENGQPLSDEDIREEVDTFMFEGNDTVSSALSFALFEIARNDRVQRKLYDEIVQVFGRDENVKPTITELQQMSYLELVVKETLRLYPSVPLIERELQKEAHVDSAFTNGDEYIFPKGTTIVLNAYAIHRNEKIYPDPEKFIPERFSKHNLLDKSSFAYLPFSAGPRNCIGQKFAMLEMKATIVKILNKFHLKPVHPAHTPKVYSDSVLKSYNGLPVRIELRNSNYNNM